MPEPTDAGLRGRDLIGLGGLLVGAIVVGTLLAISLSVGVGLGLLNHLATEFWLLRIIASGAQPSRGAMTRSTIARLVVLSVVAVGLTIALWPDGVGVLMGLAIFRLIALTMTS